MSFIGNEGKAAPKLKDAAERMSAEDLGSAYSQVRTWGDIKWPWAWQDNAPGCGDDADPVLGVSPCPRRPVGVQHPLVAEGGLVHWCESGSGAQLPSRWSDSGLRLLIIGHNIWYWTLFGREGYLFVVNCLIVQVWTFCSGTAQTSSISSAKKDCRCRLIFFKEWEQATIYISSFTLLTSCSILWLAWRSRTGQRRTSWPRSGDTRRTRPSGRGSVQRWCR